MAHAVQLRILARRNDSNRKRIFSLQLTAHSWWLLSSYRLPHYGNRSFAVALDDILPYSPSRRQILHVRSGWRLTFPSLWRSFIQLSFWTGVRMPCEKNENGIVARSEESITLMTSYRLPHHGNRSFAVALDDILPYSPSRRQILHVRSGWRLTFPSLWRSFIQLSFWTGVRMPYEKDEKRNSGMEWRIYYLYDVLPSSSPR